MPEPRQPILATLCYLKRRGQTLLLHRNKRFDDRHYGKWNGLGGKFQPGETPEQCVVRETFEESGLEVSPESLILHGTISFPTFDGLHDWYVFVFTAHDFAGTLREGPEGTLRWVDDDEIPALDLWPGDRVFLPWLTKPRFFSGRFVYDKGQFVGHTVHFYEGTCPGDVSHPHGWPKS